MGAIKNYAITIEEMGGVQQAVEPCLDNWYNHKDWFADYTEQKRLALYLISHKDVYFEYKIKLFEKRSSDSYCAFGISATPLLLAQYFEETFEIQIKKLSSGDVLKHFQNMKYPESVRVILVKYLKPEEVCPNTLNDMFHAEGSDIVQLALARKIVPYLTAKISKYGAKQIQCM